MHVGNALALFFIRDVAECAALRQMQKHSRLHAAWTCHVRHHVWSVMGSDALAARQVVCWAVLSRHAFCSVSCFAQGIVQMLCNRSERSCYSCRSS